MQFCACSSQTRGIHDTRGLSLSQTLFHFCHYIFSHFFSIGNIFFSNTLRLSLNFNNVRNVKDALTWLSACYAMCGRTGLKHRRPLHLRSLFSLATINPLKSAGFGETFHRFPAFMGMLQMLPLVLKNAPFPCIIAIFRNKILLEIRSFSNFFKSVNSSVIGSKDILLQTTWHNFFFL